MQWLDPVRQHRAIAGLDECFDGHARRELDLAETAELIRRHRDTDEIITLPGALVGAGISGNARDRL